MFLGNTLAMVISLPGFVGLGEPSSYGVVTSNLSSQYVEEGSLQPVQAIVGVHVGLGLRCSSTLGSQWPGWQTYQSRTVDVACRSISHDLYVELRPPERELMATATWERRGFRVSAGLNQQDRYPQ